MLFDWWLELGSFTEDAQDLVRPSDVNELLQLAVTCDLERDSLLFFFFLLNCQKYQDIVKIEIPLNLK